MCYNEDMDAHTYSWSELGPKQYPEVVNVRCPEGTKERIDEIAAREGVKASTVTRRALLEYLDREMKT